MQRKWKNILIGKPLKTSALKTEKLGILWGLPILASDAISSVAYAGQEMLLVLIPVLGLAAFGKMTALTLAVLFLLIILVISYRQTIDAYPSGGGAFIVAKENLGEIPGMVAGSALAINYILTVAVSISSGVEQIVSAFRFLVPYTVPIAVFLVLLLMLGTLRGIRESSRLFGLPSYAFILGILILIIWGAVKLIMGYIPPEPELTAVKSTDAILILVLLKAFASGCTALTGVEAVSNAVPDFKRPPTKYAKIVLVLLGGVIVVLFGGTSVIANLYHVVPGENSALLIVLAEEIFGHNFLYYYVTATTFIILILAANTAYTVFPNLIAIMAKEKYAPKQLARRGDKLSFDNGIFMLAAISILLIVAFKADVSSLLGLYAIGVFISFTLSQFGMFMKWRREKSQNWRLKAMVNGVGAFLSALVVVIIAIAKFAEGAWIVVLLLPVMVFSLNKIYIHYVSVDRQLTSYVTRKDYQRENFAKSTYHNKIIVPIENINETSVRALRYAHTISDNVTAFHVALDEESAEQFQEIYDQLGTTIPLVIKMSPYRRVVDSLLRYIESSEYDHEPGDMTTVLISEFMLTRWWHSFLHNRTTRYIEKKLMTHKHIVVSIMPLQLRDDLTSKEIYEKESSSEQS